MRSNPLLDLQKFGQSVWLDMLSRTLLSSGTLDAYIREDGIRGVTSNPTLFDKAIGESALYDAELRALAEQGKTPAEIFEALAIQDVQEAADLLSSVYQASQGGDGFVSLEVSPKKAYDPAATLAEARRLWTAVHRDNLMIKVPGTHEGLPAIRTLLSEGINVNITLLFSTQRHEEVMQAYLSALEDRVAAGKPIDRIASVASFFVSRVDTRVDAQLSEKGDTPLQGKAAIANAKRAYQNFKRVFSSGRFQPLARKGARAQRVLWASTSTKNPAYRDVLYVEELIGKDTINTLPEETVRAFRDHGRARASLEENLVESERTLADLAAAGIDLKAVTEFLEKDGVQKFTDSLDRLLQRIQTKSQALLKV